MSVAMSDFSQVCSFTDGCVYTAAVASISTGRWLLWSSPSVMISLSPLTPLSPLPFPPPPPPPPSFSLPSLPPSLSLSLTQDVGMEVCYSENGRKLPEHVPDECNMVFVCELFSGPVYDRLVEKKFRYTRVK